MQLYVSPNNKYPGPLCQHRLWQIKLHEMKKKLYSKNMANFEAFYHMILNLPNLFWIYVCSKNFKISPIQSDFSI